MAERAPERRVVGLGVARRRPQLRARRRPAAQAAATSTSSTAAMDNGCSTARSPPARAGAPWDGAGRQPHLGARRRSATPARARWTSSCRNAGRRRRMARSERRRDADRRLGDLRAAASPARPRRRPRPTTSSTCTCAAHQRRALCTTATAATRAASAGGRPHAAQLLTGRRRPTGPATSTCSRGSASDLHVREVNAADTQRAGLGHVELDRPGRAAHARRAAGAGPAVAAPLQTLTPRLTWTTRLSRRSTRLGALTAEPDLVRRDGEGHVLEGVLGQALDDDAEEVHAVARALHAPLDQGRPVDPGRGHQAGHDRERQDAQDPLASKAPRLTSRCLPPGAKSPQRCAT